MSIFIKDEGPRCPKCKNIAINLIREIPKMIKVKYPIGICRKCKREELSRLRRLL